MAMIRGLREAFGKPGIEPRWTQGDKNGVGTAYSATSRIWFTLWNGAVTEVYYPTIDLPQIRDLQYLVSDGETFFHEEKRHLRTETRRISHH
ncbi:MAG TPA: glucan 1,4-alpha-glucosidase, partial [Nitrospirota bacterium]